jgi:hypothetical protein
LALSSSYLVNVGFYLMVSFYLYISATSSEPPSFFSYAFFTIRSRDFWNFSSNFYKSWG